MTKSSLRYQNYQPTMKKIKNSPMFNSQNIPVNNKSELIKLEEQELILINNSEVAILGYAEFGENLEIYGNTLSKGDLTLGDARCDRYN